MNNLVENYFIFTIIFDLLKYRWRAIYSKYMSKFLEKNKAKKDFEYLFKHYE